jgi:carboxypeptidase C (cathepsin A)
MFYVAYFKKGAAPKARPVTFLFSGGPGSSTVWLHMGAFGLKRVVTVDNTTFAGGALRDHRRR